MSATARRDSMRVAPLMQRQEFQGLIYQGAVPRASLALTPENGLP
jgi:hypothetical protein